MVRTTYKMPQFKKSFNPTAGFLFCVNGIICIAAELGFQ